MSDHGPGRVGHTGSAGDGMPLDPASQRAGSVRRRVRTVAGLVAFGIVSFAVGAAVGSGREAGLSAPRSGGAAPAVQEVGITDLADADLLAYGGGRLFLTMRNGVSFPCGRGESVDQRNKDAIDVTSFSFNVKSNGDGNPVFSPLRIVKSVDSSTVPMLSGACMFGNQTIPEVRLAGAFTPSLASAPFEIRLANARVSAATVAASNQGGSASNVIEFDGFDRITITYTRMLSDGTLAPQQRSCWDLRFNVAC